MSGSLTTSNSQLRISCGQTFTSKPELKTRPSSVEFRRVICGCRRRSRVCVSDHAKCAAEVETFLLFIHLHFPVLQAGADPQETSEGNFTSRVSDNTKIAVIFISLVIVDLTFHSGCDFQDERLRSHAPPHPQLEVEEECSEYAFSAIPLYFGIMRRCK